MIQPEHVVLVDKYGNVSGQKEKLKAHQSGELHQAFSIMLYQQSASGNYEYLLQQRAQSKYHSGGLWTNTCCSHPRPGEKLEQGCIRRLKEEMGILQSLQLKEIGVFCYHAYLDNGLIEHERDHIWVAEAHALTIEPEPAEVMHYEWCPVHKIHARLAQYPEQFTAWFSEVFTIVNKKLQVDT
ncbi:MAG: isopentenyl-diphosphate Delta-isomerase [Endozoicomonas sp. (ex Botrylloides leachii)]|nr:isopentenyl-diphosphate Delta-isomerase [Endozoicomonas sp. (ex Botrylloides leachii)]